MIYLRSKRTDDGENQIIFTPRAGFKRTHAEQSRELIYGHRCPTCNNVIQALFKTDEELNLWMYEETTILSQGEKNAGEILKIYPGEKNEPGDSCYRSEFDRATHSQKIVLKNHILRHQAIQDRIGKVNGDGIWEVGERPCSRTGIYAIREDLLIKDVLLFSTMNIHDAINYNIPNLDALLTPNNNGYGAGYGADLLALAPAIGNALPVVLVDRSAVVMGYQHTLRPRITQYHISQAATANQT